LENPSGTILTMGTYAQTGEKLVFDPIRHKTILNFPPDYPRINQFPEWFTLDPLANYHIISYNSKLTGTCSGAKLLDGIAIKIEGATYYHFYSKRSPLIDKRGLTKTNN
tara:strand:+ start:1297 stop:1623 length:327 start_codon:yes stop_codon:yes gene_type:complete